MFSPFTFHANAQREFSLKKEVKSENTPGGVSEE
jgi:hypothetical protein